MAWNITTSGGGLPKVAKKLQGLALYGFAKRSEHWNRFRDLKDWDMGASAREVTTPIDLVEQPSGSFISEGGYESVPRTVDLVDLTFPWVQYNDRYSFTRTAEHLDRRFRKDQIIPQFKHQTKKLMESLVRRVGIGAFGVSTGVLCQTTTAATQSSGTYALANGFGVSGLGNAAYLSQFFKVGDYVALVRSGAIVANSAGGEVTAVSASSGITVTWPGSVASQSGDNIVLANVAPVSGLTTLAGATEYNKAPHGLVDFAVTASIHGQSSSSYPLWAVAETDTTASYLTGTIVLRKKQNIKTKGGGNLSHAIISQGVERGLHQSTSSAVQFNDPLNMQIVGNVKAKGVTMESDPLCPPGWGFFYDQKSLTKWSITEFPTGDETSIEGDPNTTVDKIQDVSGSALSFDLLYQFVIKNRGNMAVCTSLSEA